LAPRLISFERFRVFQRRLVQKRGRNCRTLVVPAGACGLASGAGQLIAALQDAIRKAAAARLSLRVTGCHGFCEQEPSVLVEPEGTFYPRVGLEHVGRLVEATARGEILEDLLWLDPGTGKPVARQTDLPFFRKQVRTIMSRNERVDPVRVESYIESEGYSALVKVLERGDPQWVVEEVVRSGLRGRGGAGFSTGAKWRMLANQPGPHGKFLVCNADEGDPGAYMDRSVLEGNPHSIIEGMLIGAYATGATKGIIYVRNEYPLAIEHMHLALAQAQALGLLGSTILGTDFCFDIAVVQGAGAFVCGEETALIRSIEGKMGEPRQRPPFPIQKGIDGKPTAINNVETWANIPPLIMHGAEKFLETGTPGSTGTKVFSLVGKVRNTGLAEVPMGMSIKEIVYDIGGGALGKSRVKAVQTGGPSGGCIPARLFDLPIDYDSLAEAGTIMGSGGMIVMDETTCMVDLAKYFMNFLKGESCGKCFSCRKGTQRMYELLDDISQGRGTLAHIDLLEELAHVVKDTTMCGLGQTAANPVLSTLRYFREEYERHVVQKRCDAFVCTNLVGAACQMACPLETQAWRYAALIEKGQYDEAYRIIREVNPFPAVSARVCDRKCEQRCRLGTTGAEPLAVRALKRFVTDRVDPSVYAPSLRRRKAGEAANVAVVGAGPAGLTATHYLSIDGYGVTLFDAEQEVGGMLMSCIPEYRLPHNVVRQEVQSLLNENITVRYGVRFGRDLTLEHLFKEGFRAVFLAIGADKSWRLDLDGEGVEGVYSSMEFLKAFNLRGIELARGRVGIIGGGNSAVDAARVAMRQKAVESVTLLYRRTCDEMPAYAEEVDAALEEGIQLHTLVSPVAIRYIDAAMKEGVKVETMVSPVKIHSRSGHLAGIDCVRNTLGGIDSSGRRQPDPVAGSEFSIAFDTLIVAIGERPDTECFASMGLAVEKNGRLRVDPETLATAREGVFAGGDLITGPNTVIDAIAAGKKAAVMIGRYLQGQPLARPARPNLPDVFLEAVVVSDQDLDESSRQEPPMLQPAFRKKNFAEVELSFGVEAALAESRRCLRCDLQFTNCGESRSAECAGRKEHQA